MARAEVARGHGGQAEVSARHEMPQGMPGCGRGGRSPRALCVEAEARARTGLSRLAIELQQQLLTALTLYKAPYGGGLYTWGTCLRFTLVFLPLA